MPRKIRYRFTQLSSYLLIAFTALCYDLQMFGISSKRLCLSSFGDFDEDLTALNDHQLFLKLLKIIKEQMPQGDDDEEARSTEKRSDILILKIKEEQKEIIDIYLYLTNDELVQAMRNMTAFAASTQPNFERDLDKAKKRLQYAREQMMFFLIDENGKPLGSLLF